jgi:hypothetical protein
VGGTPNAKLTYEAVIATDDVPAYEDVLANEANEAVPATAEAVIAAPLLSAQLDDNEFTEYDADVVLGQIRLLAVEEEILLDAQLDDNEILDELAYDADNTEPLSANQPPKDVTVTRYVVNELLSTNGTKSSAFTIEKSLS